MAAWPAVLDELMRTRRGALIGYAALLTGDVPSAEDVVHDAIVKAFSHGRQFTAVNTADAYVRRTIVSVFIDRKRREQRFRKVAPAVATAPAVPAPETGIDLDRALASLSPQQRAAIVLRFYDDLTVRQIAQRMGLAEGTVKRYLHEAQAHLAVVYRPDLELPAPHDEPAVTVIAHTKETPR